MFVLVVKIDSSQVINIDLAFPRENVGNRQIDNRDSETVSILICNIRWE